MSRNDAKTIKTPKQIVSEQRGNFRVGLDACSVIFKTLVKYTLNVFFPPNIKCISCGDDLKSKRDIEVCEHCIEKMARIEANQCCAKCGAPTYGESKACFNCKENERHFDIGRSMFVYEGEVAKLISGLKFNNKPYFSRTLGRYLAKFYGELGWEVDLVIPVPMTDKRKKWRGYNQAELLAREFCEETGLTLNTEALIKVKDTDSQKELGKDEREKNLVNAFRVVDKYIFKDKSILIIDDVMTTGSTADAVAKALRTTQAKNIYVLTLAHGRPIIASQGNLENIKSVINSVK